MVGEAEAVIAARMARGVGCGGRARERAKRSSVRWSERVVDQVVRGWKVWRISRGGGVSRGWEGGGYGGSDGCEGGGGGEIG